MTGTDCRESAGRLAGAVRGLLKIQGVSPPQSVNGLDAVFCGVCRRAWGVADPPRHAPACWVPGLEADLAAHDAAGAEGGRPAASCEECEGTGRVCGVCGMSPHGCDSERHGPYHRDCPACAAGAEGGRA